jgi:hypothetical protein
MKLFLHLAAIASLAISTQAASIVFSAGLTRNGLDENGGDDLDVGNLVRVGFFALSDSQIVANQTNYSFLLANFREFDNGVIGAGVGNTDGHFSGELTNNNASDVAFLAGKQVYIWTLFSTDISSEASAIASATQHSILYLPFANDADWSFPDDLTPGRAPSLRDLTVGGLGDSLSSDSRVLVGSFGPGTSAVSGKPNFQLAPIPEPSTALLAGLGLLGLATRRRRS